jgi:cation-transporting ATPase E
VSSQPPPGLTDAEVAERVVRGETNAYKPYVERTYWQIFRDNVFNLFNMVLLALLAIIFFFRDYNDIFFAGFSVVVNTLLGTVQEINAKRALERLAAQVAHDVRVLRNGREISIPISDVVKDDVLPIEPGTRLVVDGRVLHSDSLEMDESLLTGESDAVLKEVDSRVYSGSFCIAGHGWMQATQVGENSTINKLARAAKAYRNVQTPTQRKVAALVEISVAGMLLFGPMVFIAGYVSHSSLLETVKNAVVLVTSLVPQGLVLVTTLALTLGAISISRRQTLVQRINAVESLASANVLCFDKTGTLTRNELAVTDILPLNGQSVDDIRAQLATYTNNLSHLNKTAGAIANYVGKTPGAAITKQQEIPFNSARKWGAMVFPDCTMILGAPERVLQTNGPNGTNAALQRARQLSAEGQRVLAFATSPHAPADGKLDEAREPVALIVMNDQVRSDITETLNAFYSQNVDLKVISGDNAETVSAIARQAGLRVAGAIAGDQLEALPAAEFDRMARETTIFARIEPDTKRKIIASLKRQGYYVAMVGDGVNDVPALKESNLAIAMNDGAQIAKDVADIILLNNAMSTLPLAFEEGKTITQKIYSTAKIYLVKNVYSILLFIFAGFMLLPFPINPTQISWVVFGTINLPATLIAFGVLRPAYLRHFTKDVLSYVVASGFIGSLAMVTLYLIVYLAYGRDMNMARSALTLFMVLFGVLVFWNAHGIDVYEPRTWKGNPRDLLIGLSLGVFTIGLPYLIPRTFGFIVPRLQVWALIGIIWVIAASALDLAMRNQHILDSLRQLIKDDAIGRSHTPASPGNASDTPAGTTNAQR